MHPFSALLEKIKGGDTSASDSSHAHSKHTKHQAALSRLPVLIFPGFMSSALEVKKSPSDAWVGKRVWLSVAAAGFNKIYVGSALKENEDKLERGEEYDEELHQEFKQEYECKSAWLQHFKLSDDLQSDPVGIETRALQGLDAINYLDPGGLVKHVSWVFKPVTKALIEVGYEEGKDLEAAPYDWRIPPSMLESRDSFFTNAIKQIELLYERNDSTPVVLLCHSMGCKTAHYLLNFAKAKQGQEWIDKYIHTYFPVGAPHLGAPKSMRGTIVGDKMGMDAFLSEEEALIISRSIGSVPWMYPYSIPPRIPPAAYIRREGAIHITVEPFDCLEMIRERTSKQSKFRLDVTYNGKTLHSSYESPQGDKVTALFPETFTFAAPAELSSSDSTLHDGKIRISLYESGLNMAQEVGYCSCITSILGSFVDTLFPAEFWRKLRCVKAHDTDSGVVEATALATANVATAMLGTATLIADSQEENIFEYLSEETNPVEVSFALRFGNLRKMQKELMAGENTRTSIVLGETSTLPVKVKVWWQPPQHDVDVDAITSVRIASINTDTTPDLDVHNANDKTRYEEVSGVQLLKSEFLPQFRRILEDVYEEDAIGPRTLCSAGAPPVKRVKAVYGIDIPTEVSAVYCRRDITTKEGQLKCLHEVDESARIDSDIFEIENGIILETEKSPQSISPDKVVHRSGDGTVPYYSLQQARKWKDVCDVTIDEIPQADHREILGDARFLKLLVDYIVTEPRDSTHIAANGASAATTK